MEGWEGLVPLKPKSAIETWSVQPTSLPRNILRYYRLYFPSGCCARSFSHNFFVFTHSLPPPCHDFPHTYFKAAT